MAENQQSQQGSHDVTVENTLAHKVAQKAHTLKYIVVAVLVVLAAAVAIVGYVRSANEQKRSDASDKVFRSLVEMQGKPDSEVADVFGKAAKEYAGMPAGIQAGVFEYGYAVDAGKYADAERAAADFIKNYPSSPLVPRFRLGLAQALLQQGKATEAVAALRDITVASSALPEVFAEAKLTQAQALEMNAEAAKANPDEYRRRLEEAQAVYSDIASQSRLPSPSQRGHWPQAVVLTADYALVQIKDRLAGHELQAPLGQAPEAVTPEEFETVQGIRPPAADPVADIQDAAASAQSAANAESQDGDAVAEAARAAAAAMKDAGEKVAAAATAAEETAGEAKESAAAAVQAAAEAVQEAESKAAAVAETVVDAVEDKTEEAAAAATEAVRDADAAVEEKAADAADSAAAVVDAAEEKTTDAAEAVEDAVREEGEKAFGAAARLKARADAAAETKSEE